MIKGMFLLSLDEIDRVKRLHHITSLSSLEGKTGVTRKTWSKAMRERRPTPDVLNALASLGARPERVLIAGEEQLEARIA